MKTVGIDELRQNLSNFLRLVERGEHFVVTHRNRAVAELRPVRGPAVERRLTKGRVERQALDFEPIKLDSRHTASEALREVRGN